jgi:hypothetical protein
LQSPGSDAPPSLSEDQIEFREEKSETVEKTEEVPGGNPPDQQEKTPDGAEQMDVEIKPSLEEVCSVAVESKPVAEEKEVLEEVNKQEIQPAEPSVVQEDVAEKLETVEHPEHTEIEADMTGSAYTSLVISICSHFEVTLRVLYKL